MRTRSSQQWKKVSTEYNGFNREQEFQQITKVSTDYPCQFIALLCILSTLQVDAQISSGTLKGVVTHTETGETLPFVNVVLFLNGNQITGGTTDFDGKYTIKPINPGTYDVLFSFVGYTPKRITGVVVNANKIQFVNGTLSEGVMIDEAEVVTYTVPLIDRDGGASGGTVTREDIEKLPGRDATSVATTVAGVGTVNLDNRSLYLNFEATALVADDAFIKQVESMLIEDLDNSDPVQYEHFYNKPLYVRVAANMARLASPLL